MGVIFGLPPTGGLVVGSPFSTLEVLQIFHELGANRKLSHLSAFSKDRPSTPATKRFNEILSNMK
jgi:hypothetical protein